MGSPQSRAAARAISLEAKEHDAQWELMRRREPSFDAGCLFWLTKFTKTEDNHYLFKGTPPVAPFPEKQYFAVVLGYILNSPRIFLPKSREMMTSWLVCGYIAWMCQWFSQIQWILQTVPSENSIRLLIAPLGPDLKTACVRIIDSQSAEKPRSPHTAPASSTPVKADHVSSRVCQAARRS